MRVKYFSHKPHSSGKLVVTGLLDSYDELGRHQLVEVSGSMETFNSLDPYAQVAYMEELLNPAPPEATPKVLPEPAPVAKVSSVPTKMVAKTST